jgi:hypothetical protein
MADENKNKKKKRDSEAGEDEDEHDAGEDAIKRGARTANDVQRARLDKLMKNPDKPVHIPEGARAKTKKDPNKAPAFVYNVMGSSAGAGSGEFHVYRQIRRKEQNRCKVIDKERVAEELDDAFKVKLAENEKSEQEKAEKKRNKRNKKKDAAKKRKVDAAKKKKKNPEGKKNEKESSEEDSDSDSDEVEKKKE